MCGGDPAAPTVVPSTIGVSFQPSSSSAPAGFCAAGDEGYSARGYGWR